MRFFIESKMNLRRERSIINYAQLFKRNNTTDSKIDELSKTLKKTIQKVRHHIQSTRGLQSPKEEQQGAILVKAKKAFTTKKAERALKKGTILRNDHIRSEKKEILKKQQPKKKGLVIGKVEEKIMEEKKVEMVVEKKEEMLIEVNPKSTPRRDIITVAPPGHSLMSFSKEFLYRVLNSPVK